MGKNSVVTYLFISNYCVEQRIFNSYTEPHENLHIQNFCLWVSSPS